MQIFANISGSRFASSFRLHLHLVFSAPFQAAKVYVLLEPGDDAMDIAEAKVYGPHGSSIFDCISIGGE